MHSPKKVLTIGDALITFNPSSTGPLRFVSTFERAVGGAELNFAIGIARLGLQSKWVSRLGDDEFGKVIYNFARGEGIDMSHVSIANGYPSSLNFKEIREDGSGKTFYYRYQSPILSFTEEDISEQMLDGVSILHITGVFLAIAPQNIRLVLKLVKLAKKNNIVISFDPNLRLKLWSLEEAKAAFNQLYPEIDIFLTGKDEFELLNGCSSLKEMEAFSKKYHISQFIVKDGANGASIYEESKWYTQPAFKINPVDTVGAGDAFDAAYIYSVLTEKSPTERLRFANAAGAIVTTVKGDNAGLPEKIEVLQFLGEEELIER